jgi:Ca-activated chloride channel family protein
MIFERKPLRQIVFVFFSAFLMLQTAGGQSGRKPPPPKQDEGSDTIKLRADEVLLNVTVIDPYGRQAIDLTKEEFIVAEDSARQDISSFQISAVPVNVVLMLDASGSVAGDIQSLRDAALGFVRELGAEDRISIIDFHTSVELIQEWTSKVEDVRHAISWRFKPGVVKLKGGRSTYGSTSLYDALFLAASDQLSKVEGRKAIILLTDGLDTSSKVTYEQSLASVIRSGAVVYVVSKARALIQAVGRNYAPVIERAEMIMTDLCNRTGGQIFSPLKADDIKDSYARVAREIKNQYIITYTPKNEKRDGMLREVRVYLTRAGYSARTRESYYAPKN